jgi:hypothetical protein
MDTDQSTVNNEHTVSLNRTEGYLKSLLINTTQSKKTSLIIQLVLHVVIKVLTTLIIITVIVMVQ